MAKARLNFGNKHLGARDLTFESRKSLENYFNSRECRVYFSASVKTEKWRLVDL